MSVSRAEQVGATPDFQAGLADIVGKPLTAETIDTYAESALEDLGELVQQVTSAYPVDSSSGKELEDAACAYFGLGRIEETLDHIAAKSAELQRLDEMIANVTIINAVITPPDASGRIEPGGGDGLEKRQTVPRLKTLLFVLANDFDVDINDRSQLTITKGAVQSDMFRRSSYHMVEVPELKRTILVCDEADNATFVFNAEVLEKSQISPEELIHLSKDELRALLENNSQVGQRIIYGQDFVPQIISALAELSGKDSLNRVDATKVGTYLQPTAPEGVLSMGGLVTLLQITNRRVATRVIEELGDALGEVRSYKFKYHVVEGYSPEQQALIRKHLEESGYYDTPPEGFTHKTDLSQRWDVSIGAITRVIEELGDSLGEAQFYKSIARRSPHYSPEQQRTILEALEATGIFAEDAPEGYISARSIAKDFGTGQHTVERAIGELGEDLGEISKYKLSGRIVVAYTLEQQSMIMSQLYFKGLFGELAPEGYLQAAGIAQEVGLSPNLIHKTIGELGAALGEVETYRDRRRHRKDPHYSSKQQQIIRERLETDGHLNNAPPEDYKTINSIAIALEVAHTTAGRVVKDLGEDLGEVSAYKFKGQPHPGYSPHQQEVIMQRVIEKMLK